MPSERAADKKAGYVRDVLTLADCRGGQRWPRWLRDGAKLEINHLVIVRPDLSFLAAYDCVFDGVAHLASTQAWLIGREAKLDSIILSSLRQLLPVVFVCAEYALSFVPDH